MERCLILHGTKLCQLLASRSVCKWRVQPCDSDLKERVISFVCLFIYFFCHPHFSIRIFPSASAICRYPVRVLQTPRNDHDLVKQMAYFQQTYLNTAKTEFMLIGSRQKLSTLSSQPELSIDNVLIEKVTSVKSLGIFIDENLRWQKRTSINYLKRLLPG